MSVSVRFVDGFAAYEAGASSVRPLDASVRYVHDGAGTMFVLALDPAVVLAEDRRYDLAARSYAVLPDAATVSGGSGVLIIDRSHRGLFHVGGPVEPTGRLRYIDGCSDTVLVAPVVCGDPCLNLLHLPFGVVQTDHQHPSVRVGLVLHGSGRCVSDGGRIETLAPGAVFVLPPNEVHRFETPSDEMLLLAWHPDSDSGPTDDDHPMLNRSLVPGGRERVRRAMP